MEGTLKMISYILLYQFDIDLLIAFKLSRGWTDKQTDRQANKAKL